MGLTWTMVRERSYISTALNISPTLKFLVVNHIPGNPVRQSWRNKRWADKGSLVGHILAPLEAAPRELLPADRGAVETLKAGISGRGDCWGKWPGDLRGMKGVHDDGVGNMGAGMNQPPLPSSIFIRGELYAGKEKWTLKQYNCWPYMKPNTLCTVCFDPPQPMGQCRYSFCIQFFSGKKPNIETHFFPGRQKPTQVSSIGWP